MKPTRRRCGWIVGVLVAAFFPAATGAAALYKWTDASGRIVYSDQPPPGNVKSEILKGPPPPANPNAVKDLANKELEYKQRLARILAGIEEAQDDGGVVDELGGYFAEVFRLPGA